MAKKLKKWVETDLIEQFSLKRIYDYHKFDLLISWLSIEMPVFQSFESDFLDELHINLVQRVDAWNEEELKMNFIAPLLKFFIKYGNQKYQTYFDKEVSATVEGVFLKTEADCIIAKGISEFPKNPYFCFHEYKRTKKNPEDPIAQVLEAMLIAQELNKDGKPIYGLYTIGRNWYFMVMQGKTYSISKGYEATEREELLQIIAILRKFKVILEMELL